MIINLRYFQQLQELGMPCQCSTNRLSHLTGFLRLGQEVLAVHGQFGNIFQQATDLLLDDSKLENNKIELSKNETPPSPT